MNAEPVHSINQYRCVHHSGVLIGFPNQSLSEEILKVKATPLVLTKSYQEFTNYETIFKKRDQLI